LLEWPLRRRSIRHVAHQRVHEQRIVLSKACDATMASPVSGREESNRLTVVS
jgi:hypothetical protein